MAALASLDTAGTRLRSRTSVHAFRTVRDWRTSVGRDDALLDGFASPLIAYSDDPLPSATFRFDNLEAPGGDAQARSRGPRNGEGRGVTSGDAFRSSGRSCRRRLRPVTAKGAPVCPGTLGGSARNAVATWLALLLAKDGTRA
jgi:hypothetical protein